MWLFLRSLALHLQICWQVVLGKMFMWGALVTGWGIPAIALTFALVFSGVSFRFGNTCHINHKDSLADFWIPLLVFSGATVVMQFITFGYCIRVYLASLSDTSNTTNSSGVLPSYTNSVRTISPKQAYRRVRRVIELQWRGITLVLLIVADVIFFAIVFVFMDDLSTNILKDPRKAQEWLTCILRTGGDKNQCLPLANKLVVNEATVAAVLVLLSVSFPIHLHCAYTLTNVLDERHLGPNLLRKTIHVHRLVRDDPRKSTTKQRIRQRRRAPHLQRPRKLRNAQQRPRQPRQQRY
jgi:hypothetical protein